jgi:hybrid cluster-associated redox disulfide protein
MIDIFSGNESIQEVLERMPEAAEILSMHGLGCVGCGLMGVESLLDGARGHGFEEAALKNLLQDLNEAAEDLGVSAQKPPVVTAAAAKKILEFAKQNGTPDSGLRIEVLFPPGSENVEYDLEFQILNNKEDTIVEFDGGQLFLSPTSYRHLQNCKIDFLDKGADSGFEILKV